MSGLRRVVATLYVPADWTDGDAALGLDAAFQDFNPDATVWEPPKFFADVQEGVVGPDHDNTAPAPLVHAPSSEAVWDGDADHAACDTERRAFTTPSPDDVTCPECRTGPWMPSEEEN